MIQKRPASQQITVLQTTTDTKSYVLSCKRRTYVAAGSWLQLSGPDSDVGSVYLYLFRWAKAGSFLMAYFLPFGLPLRLYTCFLVGAVCSLTGRLKKLAKAKIVFCSLIPLNIINQRILVLLAAFAPQYQNKRCEMLKGQFVERAYSIFWLVFSSTNTLYVSKDQPNIRLSLNGPQGFGWRFYEIALRTAERPAG